jgi:ribosomal protein S18 acetylase RimI-like enzyme
MRAARAEAEIHAMTVNVHVRRAQSCDAESVAPLFDAYRQFYGLASDLALSGRFIAQRLERDESIVMLAQTAEGTLLGFVQMYPTFSSLRAARVFVLYDLFVAPTARCHGVARRLMAAAVAEARTAGAVGLTLQTARTNHAAQRLYESLGWRRDEAFCEYGLDLDPPVEARP